MSTRESRSSLVHTAILCAMLAVTLPHLPQHNSLLQNLLVEPDPSDPDPIPEPGFNRGPYRPPQLQLHVPSASVPV
ncbi:hypothetical protein [Gloeobacter kilaueensis]|uniref:Uncharacterized protein n=1 Tax=Gloeobacter kilaueensis (strain ATCC BAA-2537 / CCAP 1431/1 / ULC 316 / JS1) TaxID=1183438 RepID=U5QEA9_GLOK1|nr:hypothetical protein [Gloeobacter kilaueensis]AGY57256.1 hypothetical protein GKIL_1010 [Gloeobacter kilaueensis JS1]